MGQTQQYKEESRQREKANPLALKWSIWKIPYPPMERSWGGAEVGKIMS
jgi:hypothetical protein